MIACRSRLLRRISGRGAMAMVELSLEDARAALAGREHQIAVAVSNSSRSTVLSGDVAALDELLADLEARGVFCRRVKVDVASHSPQVDPLRKDLLSALAGLAPRRATIAFHSTVTGRLLEGEDLDVSYWMRNLRDPVLFAPVIRGLAEEGYELFVEVSPHPVLVPAIEECVRGSRGVSTVVPSLRRDEDEQAVVLESLGALYAAGASVHWPAVLRTGHCVPLPSYPWQRERFWYDENQRTASVTTDSLDHPLLARHIVSSVNTGTEFWEGEIRPDPLHPTAKPAALLLQAVLAVAGRLGDHDVGVSDLSLHRPLDLGGAGRTIQLVASAEAVDVRSFQMNAAAGGSTKSPDWMLLATGRFASCDPGVEALGLAESPDTVRERCEKRDGAGETAMAGRLVEALWSRPGEALARLQRLAAPGWQSEAGVLDACLGTLAILESVVQRRSPVAAATLRAVGNAPLARARWVHAIRREAPESAAAPLVSDVVVLDEKGRPILEARGLVLALDTSSAPPDAILYRLHWRRAPLVGAGPATARAAGAGPWLLLGGGESSIVDRIASLLRSRGHRCVVATPGAGFSRRGPDLFEVDPANPADIQQLLVETGQGTTAYRGILHLWSLTTSSEALQRSVPEAAAWGCSSVLSTVQALTREAGSSPPRLWLVTRAAQHVADGDEVLPVHAPLWGMGAVVALEHSSLRCTRVDLPASAGPNDADLLVAELLADGDEDRLAFRDNARYVARLVAEPQLLEAAEHIGKVHLAVRTPGPAISTNGPVALRSDATYLITGGLGALGLGVARWMVERGALHLVLVGRRRPADAARVALEELVRQGAQIRVLEADVARAVDVDRILDEIDRDMPVLAGIVHAAGVLDDGILADLKPDRFQAVLAPKVDGAWNLHIATRDRPLDLFVLFSSVAGVLGSAGQASYAAGNAFLDALAHHRRALGRTAISIDWGPWGEMGLAAARSDRGERLARLGLPSLMPRQAFAVFEQVLATGATQVVAAALDARRWRASHPTSAGALLAELAPGGEAATASAPSNTIVAQLHSATDVERRTLLERYLADQVGQVLRIPSGKVDVERPLRSLGLDSLMSIELRNRLENGLGLWLSATLVFNHPTIVALAAHLEEQLDLHSARSAESHTKVGDEQAALRALQEIEELSDDEVRRLLASGVESSPLRMSDLDATHCLAVA